MNKTRHAAAFFGGSIESYQFSMINIRGAYFIVIALWHKTPHKVAQKIKYKNAFYLRKHLTAFWQKVKVYFALFAMCEYKCWQAGICLYASTFLLYWILFGRGPPFLPYKRDKDVVYANSTLRVFSCVEKNVFFRSNMKIFFELGEGNGARAKRAVLT